MVEEFYDISLDIPKRDTPWKFAELLALFLQAEEVEKTCETCQCKTASVRHEIVTLPKVLMRPLALLLP